MIDIEPSLYDLIGGGTGLRKLVERFYDLVDSAPEAAQIRALHPKSLKQSREKFLCSSPVGLADLRYTLKNMGIPVYGCDTCHSPSENLNAISGYGV